MTEQELRSFIAELRNNIPMTQDTSDTRIADLLTRAADELERALPPETDDFAAKIQHAYNEWCTSMPASRLLSPRRISNIRARYKEDKERSGLQWWTNYFIRASRSDFLAGRKTDFTATFDWLINKSNMLKVLEGNYDNRVAPARGQREQDSFLDSVTAEHQRRVQK